MATSINRLRRFLGIKVSSANFENLSNHRLEQLRVIYSQLRVDVAAVVDDLSFQTSNVAFDCSGRLKPGLHRLSMSSLEGIYGHSQQRLWLLEGMRRALSDLKFNGCRQVFIGGSFVSKKSCSNDFDLLYDLNGMSLDALLGQAPRLYPRSDVERRLQIEHYGGQVLPLTASPGISYSVVPSLLEFMLYDDRFDEYKGVVALTP